METKYPALKRPKRKLCYLTNPDSPVKKWTGKLSLGDIEKMFYDLDSPSTDEVDLAPSSPLHHTSDNETNQGENENSPAPQEELPRRPMVYTVSQTLSGFGNKQNVHNKITNSILQKSSLLCLVLFHVECPFIACPDLQRPKGAARNPSPGSSRRNQTTAADLDIPFKGHGPIKTSSPIEENMVAGCGCGDLNKEKDRVVSPIVFTCEGEEEAQKEPVSDQKSQTSGHSTKKSDDFELESPPVMVALSKPKMFCHKKEAEGICKESQPIQHKTPRKPENDDMVGKRKTESQKNKDPPVPAVRQEPELKVHNKKSESVQKKPSAEVSTHTGKDVTGFLQKLREAGQVKPTCSRKSLSPVKVPTPPPEPEDDFWILEDETPFLISIPTKTASSKKQRRKSSADKSSSIDKEVKEKVKGKQGEKKKNEEAKSGNENPELSNPKDPPEVNVTEQGKQNQKKQQLQQVLSKERDKSGEQPEDTAASDTDKAQKPSEIRKRKPSKEKKENVKRVRPKKVKEIRKEGQGCDAGQKVAYNEEPQEESGDPEGVGSPSDEEVFKPEAQAEVDPADGSDEQIKAPVSDSISTKDDQIHRIKRKKQHGPCTLSSQDEIEGTDRQPTAKKLKQVKKLKTAAPSPVKKEKVLKRKGKTGCAQELSKIINKEKKINKSKPGKTKETEEVREKMEAAQEEVLNEDRAEHSSPFDLTKRDHTLRTEDQVFQRVYYSSSAEKHSITVPASPRGQREQLSAAEPKRRRKPPGNWWLVGSPTVEEENFTPQPQPKEPRLQKEKKKQRRQSKLGTPKNGNVEVQSKPQREAPVPLLNVKPPSAPKTIKRSLATFKDIFTSNTETPTLLSNRGAGRTNASKVTTSDASVLDEGVGEVLSMEPEEIISSPQQDSLQDQFPSVNCLKGHRSGPVSMIELQEYEDDNSALVTGVHGTLSASDLYAPPLKPLVLQPKDKANLAEWFKYLWSATVDSGPEITPDHFDWYFHQGRAIGFLVDLNCGTICNGKMLLGSYMKKPLWVDHSATSVFNLFTSSVSVTINGSESRYSPGQSFMVPCGHAYSIKNILGQPAMLCFTRIFAESSD